MRQLNRNRRTIKSPDNNALVEAIKQPLYSAQTLQATTSQSLNFFTGGANAGKLITNLTSAGNLPSPQAFSLYGLSLHIQRGIQQADLQNFFNNSVVSLALSQKPYLDLPVHYVPTNVGIRGISTVTNTYDVYNYSPKSMVDLTVDRIPIDIFSQQEFTLSLTTFNTVAFTTTIDITMYFHGVLYRPVL